MNNDTDTIKYEEDIPDEKNDDGDVMEEHAIKKLKAELTECRKLQKEYLEGWQRAKADYINYKKDESKRFSEISQAGIWHVIKECIMVLDSFNLAMKHDMPETVRQGMLMIQSQLEDIFKRHGFEEMKTLGKKFDPQFHESVEEIESDKELGIIIEEVQRGYLLNGAVIRPARVKIAKGI